MTKDDHNVLPACPGTSSRCLPTSCLQVIYRPDFGSSQSVQKPRDISSNHQITQAVVAVHPSTATTRLGRCRAPPTGLLRRQYPRLGGAG